jgi:DsbC/DsbD-like thiol-disulfide interchange protein
MKLNVMTGMSLLARAVLLPAILAPGVLLGIGFGETGLAASVGESAWVEKTDSRVRLVSGTLDGRAAPYAGVQLRMDPGWKTYWQNPGDSGVPPAFDWSGSKNLKNAEVLYPVPHRLTEAGGTAIGYDNEVVFPVKITPEREGEPVELALTFDYGLCKDLCIPNTVELHAAIPADLGKGDAFLIGTALARVPKPAEANALPRIASVEAKLDGPKQGLIIEALFPEGASATDLFVNSPEVLVPVPKPVGPLAEGKQRFTVTFFSAEEAAAIKGKPLRFTLVSDQGSSETVWTAE